MRRVTSLCLLVVATLLSPRLAIAEAKAADAIEIGAFLCLSGNCADWGTAALRGATLAVQELNAAGGVLDRKITIKAEDTHESTSGLQAVSAFKKLTSVDGLHFLIGPSWSPGALAVAPIASKDSSVLVITPSASAEEFSRAGSNLFNMRPAERVQTEALAEYALRQGWKRAAVLGSSQPAERTQGLIFKETFSKAGGGIVRYVESTPTSSDVRSETLQVVASKPDVVFLIAYNQMHNAAVNLRSLGFTGATMTIGIDDARIASAQGAVEGYIVAKALPPGSDFSEKFTREFHEAPGLSAENGYDAVHGLAYAIRAAGSLEPTQVALKLAGISFVGAAGPVSFSAERSVLQRPALYRVTGGRLAPL